jgi:hypothetical protein
MNWFIAYPLCVASAGVIVSIVGSIGRDVQLATYGIGLFLVFSVVSMAFMEMFK